MESQTYTQKYLLTRFRIQTLPPQILQLTAVHCPSLLSVFLLSNHLYQVDTVILKASPVLVHFSDI